MILVFIETDGVTGDRLTLGEAAIPDGSYLKRDGRYITGDAGISGAVQHNLTTGKQGGQAGEYYHLTAAEYGGNWGAKSLISTVACSFGTGTTIGNLTLANGSITDSSGAISFGDENLTTTGVITGNSFITASNIGIAADTDILQLTNNILTINGELVVTSPNTSVNTLTLIQTNVGDADVSISFQNEGGQIGRIFADESEGILQINSNAQGITVTNTSRVGINQNQPETILELWDDDASPTLTITAAHNTDYDPTIQFKTDVTDTVKSKYFLDGTDDVSYFDYDVANATGKSYVFQANGVTKLTIADAGVTVAGLTICTGNLQLVSGIVYPDADAVNSIRFTKADAATNVMYLDTTNVRVAIGGGGAPDHPCQITGNTRIHSGTLLMNTLSTAELHSTVTDKTGAAPPFSMITNASTSWPFAMVTTQNNANGCNLAGFKTRSTTTSGPATTIVQNGDTIMNIVALGADGVSYRHAAWIQATVDAAPAVGKCPGAWTFWATDSAGTFAQRLTISGTDGIYLWQDNYYIKWGAGKDCGITYDGTDMLFYANLVGTGVFKFKDATIHLETIASGATQAAAGAVANEVWKTSGHATLPDNILMIGV